MSFEGSQLLSIVEECHKIDDVTWGLSTLVKDPIYGSLSPEQKRYILDESLLCGVREAAALLESCPGSDPAAIADKFGIAVHRKSYDSGASSGIVYFGEFKKGKIYLSDSMILEIEELIRKSGLRAILGDFDVASVFIAHELFHYIESTAGVATSRLKVKIKQLGFLSREVTPLMASEIAASAFAKFLLKLNFSPVLLEIIGLYRKNLPAAVRLSGLIKDLAGINR
jgi:hypothetical protein